MTQATNNMVTYIWSLVDLLRGDLRQSQYGRIILPFVLLRRLECVLEKTKPAVLAEYDRLQKRDLSEEAQEKLLLRASALSFFNISGMDLSKLGESDISGNLRAYIQGFSKDVREIFEYFDFDGIISQLNDANLLYKVVQRIKNTDLNPETISNYEMGLVFEELIRRFAESSNDTAGEHFTPRDIVQLTTALAFLNDDEALTKPGVIRTIYDPTAGTGGFLSAGMEYVRELNPRAVMRAFGQELNLESYAICKADMLIKGQDVSNIKHGNTLSDDQLYADRFDYMLSNPPFCMDWRRIEQEIRDEHKLKGFDGRFGAGLPRVSDGSLLFLLHLISKMRGAADGGGRIGIILNGSPLFAGGAGSGESEIRRYILESDLLEAIVALPADMFFNTGIQSYVLILSNNKTESRKNKVQIINARELGVRMRPRINSKGTYLDQDSVAQILGIYATNADGEYSRIYHNNDFGYRYVRLKLPNKETEYEKIPIGEDVEEYLNRNLVGIYDHYLIDDSFVDDNDRKIGKVGYDFSLVLFKTQEDQAGKQFRSYFEEVSSKDSWEFCIKGTGYKVILKSDSFGAEVQPRSAYFFRIKDAHRFAPCFLDYFFSTPEWREWLVANRADGTIIHLNKHDLIRRRIWFPSIDEQQNIVEILDGINKWRQKLGGLESDVWSKRTGSYIEEKYRLPVSKDLAGQVTDIAPFPIANIIHHYNNIAEQEYKARYELLLKLFECLSIFMSSIFIGYMDQIFDEGFSQTLLKKKRSRLKNASFGVWVNLLKDVHGKLESNDTPWQLLESSLNKQILELFDDAVVIRNETSGHGSYPTKAAARETLKKTEGLYDKFLEAFYDLFDQTSLIRPLTATWDGDEYNYQVEEFKGLGCYPFGLKDIKSASPLISNELYLMSNSGSDKIHLFPFVRLIDIEGDSELEAFYFFSKVDNQNGGTGDEFLYISHQQINRQSQRYKDNRISRIFNDTDNK